MLEEFGPPWRRMGACSAGATGPRSSRGTVPGSCSWTWCRTIGPAASPLVRWEGLRRCGPGVRWPFGRGEPPGGAKDLTGRAKKQWDLPFPAAESLPRPDPATARFSCEPLLAEFSPVAEQQLVFHYSNGWRARGCPFCPSSCGCPFCPFCPSSCSLVRLAHLLPSRFAYDRTGRIDLRFTEPSLPLGGQAPAVTSSYWQDPGLYARGGPMLARQRPVLALGGEVVLTPSLDGCGQPADAKCCCGLLGADMSRPFSLCQDPNCWRSTWTAGAAVHVALTPPAAAAAAAAAAAVAARVPGPVITGGPGSVGPSGTALTCSRRQVGVIHGRSSLVQQGPVSSFLLPAMSPLPCLAGQRQCTRSSHRGLCGLAGLSGAVVQGGEGPAGPYSGHERGPGQGAAAGAGEEGRATAAARYVGMQGVVVLGPPRANRRSCRQRVFASRASLRPSGQPFSADPFVPPRVATQESCGRCRRRSRQLVFRAPRSFPSAATPNPTRWWSAPDPVCCSCTGTRSSSGNRRSSPRTPRSSRAWTHVPTSRPFCGASRGRIEASCEWHRAKPAQVAL